MTAFSSSSSKIALTTRRLSARSGFFVAGTISCLVSGILPNARASAQGLDGAPRIARTANVELAIEEATQAVLSRVTEPLTRSMDQIRPCFDRELVRNQTLQGSMRLTLDVGARRTAVSTLEDSFQSAPLMTCVTRVLNRLSHGERGREIEVNIRLHLINDAAASIQTSQARTAENDAVTIERDGENIFATAGLQGLRVIVRAPSAAQPAVEEATRSARAALPNLLDCRRRAARRSPVTGEIKHDWSFVSGNSTLRLTQDGIQRPNAASCVATALEHSRRAPTGNGNVSVSVFFE